jgi:hypothetical protein
VNALPESLEPSRLDVFTGPALPKPRGPVTEILLASLASSPGTLLPIPTIERGPLADDDLHLALYCCYELHYRGFAGVDPAWEWQPALIEFCRVLERDFEAALLETYGPVRQIRAEDVEGFLKEAAEDGGPPLSTYLRRTATMEQFKEFVVHRSAYQLKEADPHSFAVPRLEGRAKAAMVEIQTDEYGSGREDRMHSVLFQNTMTALGLDPAYGAYLDLIPGVTLATVNLVSMFGLHRRWRGAAVGHLAHFEMTSSQPNRRYGDGLRRLGYGPDATGFYDEHVVADSVHELVALHDLAGSLAQAEPALAGDIVFGALACAGLDRAFAAHLLARWEQGKSSLT